MAINQLKNRNQASRDRYHRRNVWNAFAQSLKTNDVQNLYRQDLQTGEITLSSSSKMNAEIMWFQTFTALKTVYSMDSSVAWESLKRGATLYTETACYWLETVKATEVAAA